MPRCARIKSSDSVYHIMVRSISDTPLFRCCRDKDKYLSLIRKYQNIFLFKVYAYCIMDTHAHMIIDPYGADISRIMHGINQSYAQYFNIKYKRRGHLFQDRFKSKVINEDRYIVVLSSYIHNNPKDIKGYGKNIEGYRYSSLGIYLGLREDEYEIVDTGFILGQFSMDYTNSVREYSEFVHSMRECGEAGDAEFVCEGSDYRSEKRVLPRDTRPDDVIDFVSSYTGIDKSIINIKYMKRSAHIKSLSVLLMRGFCSMRQCDICRKMGDITQSSAARLCTKGLELVQSREEYKNIIRDFIERRVS